LEVARERGVRLDGDELAVVLPYAVEERGQELAPLGWGGLSAPEAGEVAEDLLGLVELRIEGVALGARALLGGPAGAGMYSFLVRSSRT